MPQLKLIMLKCNVTEDNLGADEPYLKINQNVIWGPGSLNNGQSAALGLPPIDFTGTLSLELWEQDTGFLDPDDFLGAVTFSAASAGSGQKIASFTGDGANYSLTYEITGAADGKKPKFPITDSIAGAAGDASISIDEDGVVTFHMHVTAAQFQTSATRYVAWCLVTGYKDGSNAKNLLRIEPQSLTVGSSPLHDSSKDQDWTFNIAPEDVNNIRHTHMFLDHDKSSDDFATQIINTCKKAGDVWNALNSLYKEVSNSELGQAIVLVAETA